MFHNRGKAVFWMDSCVIIMTLRKFPKLYGWAKGNNCWIFLWLSVKLLMLPLLFVIIMPSHNFMVSLKQKRGELQIGRVFYCFRYVCTYVNSFCGDCVGFYIPIICFNWYFAIHWSSPSVGVFFLFQDFPISLSDFEVIFFLSLIFPISLSDFTIELLSKNLITK